MRIYVASSWRNNSQPTIVQALRDVGHEVYDFRHPGPGKLGFAWSEIDLNWEGWTPSQYRAALEEKVAIRSYNNDFRAMTTCEACVLVLPSGRSASFELGWCMGRGKLGIVYMPVPCEPELMYRDAAICVSFDEVLIELKAGIK